MGRMHNRRGDLSEQDINITQVPAQKPRLQVVPRHDTNIRVR